MMFLKKLFSSKPVTPELFLKEGTQIVDVRSPAEYATGHIPGSVNIPLNCLADNLGSIRKNQPVITCCASGMRSLTARSILRANGFSEVQNGGSWKSLHKKIA